MRFFKATALTFTCVTALCYSSPSRANYFELSANGSYFKYNNGVIGGDISYTITKKWGAGFGYHFLTNASVEINYTSSTNVDRFSQDSAELTSKLYINKNTLFQNLSLNLTLDFADKNAIFRPYIVGGGGYMIRQTVLSGSGVDRTTGVTTQLSFQGQPDVKSASANGGLGFKLFVADQIALDFSTMIYATDLDKPEIFLHYSVSGGLRFLF